MDFCFLATGSELSLALEAAKAKESENCSVRVVSIPSFERFDAQGLDYVSSTLGQAKKRVSIEAQSTFGWHKYVGLDGITIGVDQFGLSAPEKDIRETFGLTLAKFLKGWHS